MSEDWCRSVDENIKLLRIEIQEIRTQNHNLLKIVVVGLLAIVGSIAGVNVFT